MSVRSTTCYHLNGMQKDHVPAFGSRIMRLEKLRRVHQGLCQVESIQRPVPSCTLMNLEQGGLEEGFQGKKSAAYL